MGAIRLFRSFDLLEQFREPRKIKGHLTRFIDSEDAGLRCGAWVCPAVKCAKPPPLGIIYRIAAVQFEYLPRREATSSDGAGFRHERLTSKSGGRSDAGFLTQWRAAACGLRRRAGQSRGAIALRG